MKTKILWGLVAVNLFITLGLGVYLCTGRYIGDHAQNIIDSVNAHMEKQQAEAESGANDKIKANHDFLYNDPRHPVLGNKDGDVTVVEFLDYNCGYCKKAYQPLMALLDKDSNVRLMLIEIPILHESSALAAKWALAAHDQKQYAAFHKKLMTHSGPIDEALLENFAKETGLDVADMKTKAASKEIGDTLAENLNKANEMGIRGTPGFIIGEDVIRGYVELPALEDSVKKAREAK